MENVIKLAYIADKIAQNLSYPLQRKDGVNEYDEIVRELLLDYYKGGKEKNDRNVFEQLPTNPLNMVSWLQEDLKNFPEKLISRETIEKIKSLEGQPFLNKDSTFNYVYYDLIAEYADKGRLDTVALDTKPMEELLHIIRNDQYPFGREDVQKDYGVLRTFLSKTKNAAITEEAYEKERFTSYLKDEFDRTFKSFYEDIPEGDYKHCSYCGWTLMNGSYSCLHRRCYNKNAASVQKNISTEKTKRMKRGVVIYVLIPGLFEMKMNQKIKKEIGDTAKLTLFPNLEEEGDLKFEQNGETVYIDYKDHKYTERLLRSAEDFAERNPYKQRMFVYPKSNRLRGEQGIRLLNERFSQQGKSIEVLSDQELMKRVRLRYGMEVLV